MVYTKDWIPDKTKCSPRYKKYYGKYLLKNISHMFREEQKRLVDYLIYSGYKPKGCKNTKEELPVCVTAIQV